MSPSITVHLQFFGTDVFLVLVKSYAVSRYIRLGDYVFLLSIYGLCYFYQVCGKGGWGEDIASV